MFIKQVSVFLENTTGSLEKLTRKVADAGIDLYAMSIAETEHYGILRMIVSDTESCLTVLKEAGYTVRITDVLAVCVPDRPGGLADLLGVLREQDIAVEYLYSFVRAPGKHALLTLYLSDLQEGLRVLKAAGVTLMSQEHLKEL